MLGFRKGMVRLAVLSLMGAALPASAQAPGDTLNPITIPLGPVVLQPFLLSDVEHTDNVFQRQGDQREAANISTITPGFVAQLPFSHSHAFFGYALRWREYNFESFSVTDEELPPDSHYLRGQVRLVFGNHWFVSANEDYSRGVIDTQTFQGGEVRFSGEQMETSRLTGEIGIDRGPQRVLRLSVMNINDRVLGERRSGLFDTLENRAALEGEHQVRSTLWLLWAAEARDGTRSREDEERIQQEGRLSVGGRWQGPEGRQLDVELGVASARFPQVDAKDNNFVGSAGFRVPIDRTGVVAIRIGRDVYPSIVDDIYFISNSAQVEVASDRESLIGLGTAATFYSNNYPATGRGRDQQLALETWIGYRLRRFIELRLTVSGGKRTSDTQEFDYNERAVAVQLRVGA